MAEIGDKSRSDEASLEMRVQDLLPRRIAPGVTPKRRLKARVNESWLANPVRTAMAPMVT